MNNSKDLLIEIGTEELPAKMLQKLIMAFSENMAVGLTKADLKFKEIKPLVTPRRLALIIIQLDTAQPSRIIEKRGPSIAAAYDQAGNPTPACIGFANSCCVSVEQLEVRKTDKGDWLFCVQQQMGQATQKLLPQIIKEALAKLPIPKPMRWGNHEIEFVRPVHWVVLIFGEELIHTQILGQNTQRETYGHRFHFPHEITVEHPRHYVELLAKTGKVIADYAMRKQVIEKEIEKIVMQIGKINSDPELLEEITGLVEWPVALLGQFDTQFLEVPPEALETAMKHHQKCFAVRDQHNKLLPYFITISNIESKNSQRVIAGNEKVMRARLADAQFFYHSDLKHTLEHRLQELKQIIFQHKLGTLFDKSQRIAQLATHMAKLLAVNEKETNRAGLLAKADLMTTMVSEFPELQGIMGYYYALKDGETKMVAEAIRDHYKPRYAGDELPENIIGCLIALADKIDTLIGIFGINQQPTGEKDPFGLRRAAVGLLRILIEKRLPIDLKRILTYSVKNYQVVFSNMKVEEQAFNFIMERLRAWYAEQGIDADVFAAVSACCPTQPLDFDQRIHAVQYFQHLPEASALTAANKRVSNLLKKQDGEVLHIPVNPSLLELEAEKNLNALLEQKSKQVEKFCEQKSYEQALAVLAELKTPIDQFFDQVMVMVEDERLRNNRLALLANLRNLFTKIADISLLAR